MRNVVERALNLIIYLLETPRPVTAEDVRRTVAGYGDQADEAFHRMFERDKAVLKRLGVPLKRQALDAWEVDFGYTVDPDEYAIAEPALTVEERAALSLAARMVRLGGSPAGLGALLKLGGMERSVGIEPLGADLGPEAGALGALFEAITDRREVAFDYRGAPRSLSPYALAHRRGRWYVAGMAAEGERVYRVDRIGKLNVSDRAATRPKPAGFDVKRLMAAQPWETGTDPAVDAKIRFDADVAWWAARTLGLAAPEGELEATIPVSNRDALVGWALSFGDSAEVLEPADIRDEITRRVRAAMGGAS